MDGLKGGCEDELTSVLLATVDVSGSVVLMTVGIDVSSWVVECGASSVVLPATEDEAAGLDVP